MLIVTLYHIYNYYSASESGAYFKAVSIVSVSQSLFWLMLYTSIGDFLINQGEIWLIPYLNYSMEVLIGSILIYIALGYVLRRKVMDAREQYAEYTYHGRIYAIAAWMYVLLSGCAIFIYFFILLYIQHMGGTYYSIFLK